MKTIVGLSVSLLCLAGCAWLSKNAPVVEDVTIAVLCTLEHDELNDEKLNEDCDKILGHLTAQQASEVHARVASIQMARAAHQRGLMGLKPDAGAK